MSIPTKIVPLLVNVVLVVLLVCLIMFVPRLEVLFDPPSQPAKVFYCPETSLRETFWRLNNVITALMVPHVVTL